MTERSACYTCGSAVSEGDSVVTRERTRVCLGCAAALVGRKRHARESAAVIPGLGLDPELNPREWERAWSARRRRGPALNELQTMFVDQVGPLTLP